MNTDKSELQLAKAAPQDNVLRSLGDFKGWLEVANTLSQSTVVPAAYQKNPSNCLVALEMSARIGVSPMMVMQNLDIIKGKPSWSGAFIIAAINSCGRFEPLRFVFQGKIGTEEYGCRAIAKSKKTGEDIKGTLINWTMVKGEGWLSKEGSKWKTMPEQMFQYRAASFFGRLHCPDILFGMHSIDEVIDTIGVVLEDNLLEEIQEVYMEVVDLIPSDKLVGIDRIISEQEEKSYRKVLDYLLKLKPESND